MKESEWYRPAMYASLFGDCDRETTTIVLVFGVFHFVPLY